MRSLWFHCGLLFTFSPPNCVHYTHIHNIVHRLTRERVNKKNRKWNHRNVFANASFLHFYHWHKSLSLLFYKANLNRTLQRYNPNIIILFARNARSLSSRECVCWISISINHLNHTQSTNQQTHTNTKTKQRNNKGKTRWKKRVFNDINTFLWGGFDISQLIGWWLAG